MKDFKTISNRPITYYGQEFSDSIKRIKDDKKNLINSLDDLFEILIYAWKRESAYPSSQKDPEYNSDNDPTYGQCAITATLVHDMFGGTIHKIKVDGGGTHYFNKINDHYIDLTSDQFSLYNIPISYEDNTIVPREYCNKNSDTEKRFKLLIKSISEVLENNKNFCSVNQVFNKMR